MSFAIDVRVMRAAGAIAAVAVLGVLPVTAGAAAPAGAILHSAGPSGPAAAPGEIVVGFRSGVDSARRVAARSAADVHVKRNLLARGVQLVTVDRGQSVQEAIAALEKRPDVRYAEPNWIYHAASTTPDDPLFGSLWGLDNTGQTGGTADVDIDAPEAWDHNRGSASTVVAVVDSGVAWDHPDLAPNMWSNAGEIAGNGIDDDGNGKVDDVRGWDFVDADSNPWDYNDHGTHVAGTIAARGDNGVGVAGVAWQASIMAVRALNAVGSGSNANITDAFTYAADNGAKVVNASLGGPLRSQAMSDAITAHANTLFVVAAGNDNRDNETTPVYPCNYTAANVLCVAATTNIDGLASFSNRGATSVDLAAPGVGILSARPHNINLFSDDFESGLGQWTVQSGPWGTATALDTTWLVDSPGGNYADNADWAIRTTSKVDVGDRSDCMLKFSYGTFLEAGFDWLYVQSSSDGTEWTGMSTIGDTNGAVKPAALALAAGSRYYRFRLTSDLKAVSTVKNGVYIDNVRVACPDGTYGADDYQSISGTSMASPHVAGAATVLFSAKPTATVAEVRAALLDSGDPVAALSGKTVSGRRLNLDAALTAPAIRADTTTTITSASPDRSVVGQPVRVHYSVAPVVPAGGAPTGNVTVSDGTQSCTGTVAEGECTLVFTTAGAKSLTATYSGDAYDNPSPASAGASHQVDPAETTTAITSDAPDPAVVGDTVTIGFAVAAMEPGAGTPDGNVTVSDGVDSCTATVAAGQCDVTLTIGGTRSWKATYDGDADFNPSTSAAEPHTVHRLPTTTTLSSDAPHASVVGQAVIVHYSVSQDASIATPSGNVTVGDGTDSCTASVEAGQCTVAFTGTGARSLTARYEGDGIFDGSASAAEDHTVGAADTTTTVRAHAPDPSVVGQAVTVGYKVVASAPGAGTPSGFVTVTDGVSTCTAPVTAGQCTVILTTVGTRTLTASYGGDEDKFHGSTSGGNAHTVNPPAGDGHTAPPPIGDDHPVNPLIPLAHVFGASQTHRRFRVAAKPRLARISRRRAPVGTTFKFTLDRAASVRLDFTQPRSGRVRNSKCVSRTKRNRNKAKCTRMRASLALAGHAGLNAVRFKGWVSNTRKLTPGKYTLVITASTLGVGATSQKLKFTIVR
jgi:subtilisin family serine protease